MSKQTEPIKRNNQAEGKEPENNKETGTAGEPKTNQDAAEELESGEDEEKADSRKEGKEKADSRKDGKEKAGESKKAELDEEDGSEGEESAEPEETEKPEKPEKPVHSAKIENSKNRVRKHKKKHRVLRFLILIGVIAVFVAIANLSYFEIREVPVIGNKTVSDEEILKLSEIKTGSSIFFLNSWLVKSRIKDNLFISDVDINRVFPGTVEIIVKEREAAAQFVEKTPKKRMYVLTDASGMVMGRSDDSQDVTMVDNVYVTRAEEGAQIRVDEQGSYKKAMELIAAAKKGDLYFKHIHIRGSLVEAYIFDTLKCQGRYSNMIKSIETGELKSVVYKLYQDDVSKGVINIGDNNYCSFTPEN